MIEKRTMIVDSIIGRNVFGTITEPCCIHICAHYGTHAVGGRVQEGGTVATAIGKLVALFLGQEI